ncbi:MAG: MarR family winged helix-turn-helix transcriptional regulator [Bacteroidota bacterium]
MNLENEIKQIRGFRNSYHRASVNLIYTGKWIINLHNDLFEGFGLTLQQYNILRILRGQYPNALTVKVIRERMLDKMSDASRIVELLRTKGLVERDLNDRDRRKVDVKISKTGLNLLTDIEMNGNELMDGFLSNLNQEEIEQLNQLLDKLRR